MKVLVLGSGAGGGFPQWNCNCRMCAGQRAGTVQASARTQSSIAVSADGQDWVLLNASPDLGAQLRAQPQLRPRSAPRGSPIRAVVLFDSQIDHVTGLLSLREGPRLDVHCTAEVHEDLRSRLPLLTTLERYCGVDWHPIAHEEAASPPREVAGLQFSFVQVPGKRPPYADRRDDAALAFNTAAIVCDPRTGRRLFYAPGLAAVGPPEQHWLDACDCVLVDGTFWTEDEMLDQGLGGKRAADMGHLPQSDGPRGPGMLRVLSGSRARRRVLIHINNSNPILDDNGPERAELARHGIEVAFDGMEIEP